MGPAVSSGALAAHAAPPSLRAATLHIGTLETQLALGASAQQAAQQLRLRIGRAQVAGTLFKHSPPTPLEVETAIAAVEDEIMAAPKIGGADMALDCSDAAVWALSRYVPGADTAAGCLTLVQVEDLFNAFAARVQGRVLSAADLPDDNALYATLLILRELMHHLGFARIALSPASGDNASV